MQNDSITSDAWAPRLIADLPLDTLHDNKFNLTFKSIFHYYMNVKPDFYL